MNRWTWTGLTISASALAACSGGDTTGVFSVSGTGGETSSRSAANTGSNGTGGSGGVQAGGSGGMGAGGNTGTGGSSAACDDIGICSDPANPMAITCLTCARDGDCAAEAAACVADMACAQFNMCIMMCMPNDQICLQSCKMTHMAGFLVYDKFQKCVVCDNCRSSCAQYVQQLMCPPAP